MIIHVSDNMDVMVSEPDGNWDCSFCTSTECALAPCDRLGYCPARVKENDHVKTYKMSEVPDEIRNLLHA